MSAASPACVCTCLSLMWVAACRLAVKPDEAEAWARQQGMGFCKVRIAIAVTDCVQFNRYRCAPLLSFSTCRADELRAAGKGRGRSFQVHRDAPRGCV